MELHGRECPNLSDGWIGVTAVEYGLIIAIIGSVILAFTADVQSGFEGIRKILASGFGS